MILDEFEEILKQFGDKVYFGMGPNKPENYNFIVFNRLKVHSSSDLRSVTDYFEVTVLKEDYIPDDKMDEKIIKALTEGIKGLKQSSSDIEYSYWKKPNTDVNIEFMRIIFYKSRKRCY